MSSRGPGRGSNTSSPFGPYTLLRKIATGGTAEIFLARRHGVEGFARHLAIKRILPHLEAEAGFVKLLMDEARLAAHLHHGHIIPIYEVGVEAGLAYIAMEFLKGRDLVNCCNGNTANNEPFKAGHDKKAFAKSLAPNLQGAHSFF